MKRGGANLKEAERWLQQAEADLDAARVSARGGHHEWACFQSQQAAEKALKAVLHVLGYHAISSHLLVELLKAVLKTHAGFASLDAAARLLDTVYVPTRYPNGLPGEMIPVKYYTDRESKACIDSAASILTASTGTVRGSRRSSRG